MKIDIANAEKIQVQHPEDTFEIIQKIFYQKKGEVDLMKEHLWSISVNKAMKILAIELVSIGCKDRTIADPGDIFRIPLYKSSSYVILVHNHPSGNLHPSQTDKDLTNKLIKAGQILDIPVIDHVIVTEKSFFSFATAGIMDELQEDNKYALTFVYKKKMERKMQELKDSIEKERKLALKLGEKKGKQLGKIEGLKEGKQERNREIARQMLAKGMEEKLICEVTGLSRQWLGRIKSEVGKRD